MARKSTKSNPTNVNEGMEMILANEPLKTVSESAEFVGVAEIRLLELFSDTLNLPEAMGWEVIPQEHEHLLNQFKSEVNNIQALPETDATPEPAPDLEPPILEEKPEVQQKPKRQRRSSALTQKKTDAIQDNREAATQANKGITDALTLLQAQSGVRDAANAGTAYLTAFTATLTNVKGQGLQTIAAQTLQEIAAKSNFDPSELLKQLGIPVSAETLELLNASMAETLGKSAIATQEIVETSWGNGFDLESELSALDNLLNSNS